MDHKQELVNYLKSNRLMAIATTAALPNVCFVYYAVGDHNSLYFVSDPNALHSSNLFKNSEIAVAITDSTQKPIDHKKGFSFKVNVTWLRTKMNLS